MRTTGTLAGLEVELVRAGEGQPILLLHGVHDVDPNAPFVAGLSQLGEVMAPTHPGFGDTARPDDFSTMYDLVHHYRRILAALSAPAVVVGCSFGGWIAAELAAAGARMSKLVLVDPLGIKISGREERDIAHLFNTHPRDLQARAWHDPATRPKGTIGIGWPEAIPELPDTELLRLDRSNAALCLYGWRPHMYNPQLRRWLAGIAVPTLVVWGQSDRIVTPDYGRAYAAAIPGGRFELIANAGHHPDLEQPQATLEAIARFTGGAK